MIASRKSGEHGLRRVLQDTLAKRRRRARRRARAQRDAVADPAMRPGPNERSPRPQARSLRSQRPRRREVLWNEASCATESAHMQYELRTRRRSPPTPRAAMQCALDWMLTSQTACRKDADGEVHKT